MVQVRNVNVGPTTGEHDVMMTPDLRRFVLDGGGVGDDPLAGVLAELDQVFSVAEERTAGAMRRTWLDTFDWRLHNAGLILEHEQTRRGARLLLTRHDGSTVAEQPVTGWQSLRPSMPADLPAGALRDTVTPLAAPRALIPAAKAVTTRTVHRLMNPDGKTVTRLLVDRGTVTGVPAAHRIAGPADRIAGPAHHAGELPIFLSIAEVRGYPGQARRAASRIAAAPGVRPAGETVFATALSALGRHPGDYTGKVEAAVYAGMPGAVAVASVLLNLLDTLERNVAGVLRDIDTEFLHDLRVSVRRTRSAIKLLGDVLPVELIAHYRDEFKWVGDLTTPVRDLDVHLLGFRDMADSLVAATPGDIEPFHGFLARRRAQEFRQLSAGLRSTRFRAIIHDWRKALVEVRDAPGRKLAAPVASALAADRTARSYRRIAQRGAAITPQSPPESLHDLRKRCKELRYLLEFFASLYSPADYRRVLGDLKKLQDCLGEFQDSEVQREEIGAFAEAILAESVRVRPMPRSWAAPAATLLAMGEIAAGLAVRQREARAGFGRRFAGFAGPAGRQRIATLLGGDR
jgi:CHAD domain-containing protein